MPGDTSGKRYKAVVVLGCAICENTIILILRSKGVTLDRLRSKIRLFAGVGGLPDGFDLHWCSSADLASGLRE
jgi:hypothetical protein